MKSLHDEDDMLVKNNVIRNKGEMNGRSEEFNTTLKELKIFLFI